MVVDPEVVVEAGRVEEAAAGPAAAAAASTRLFAADQARTEGGGRSEDRPEVVLRTSLRARPTSLLA